LGAKIYKWVNKKCCSTGAEQHFLAQNVLKIVFNAQLALPAGIDGVNCVIVIAQTGWFVKGKNGNITTRRLANRYGRSCNRVTIHIDALTPR
jgi:hypothetical protein